MGHTGTLEENIMATIDDEMTFSHRLYGSKFFLMEEKFMNPEKVHIINC